MAFLFIRDALLRCICLPYVSRHSPC